jgi:putative colanic acid biosynthesis acetyltransferase WcaF
MCKKIDKIQNISEFKLPDNFRGRSNWYVQLWWLVQATLFRWSPQILYGWRRFLLRLFGAKIGKEVVIRPTATITFPWKVKMGDYSSISDNVTLYSLGDIEIKENSVISQNCYLCAGSHKVDSYSFEIFSKEIVIEEKVWLASDVFVAPGVTIGRGAVVGARSSVFSDLPEMMICFGTPAKPIKQRI